MPVAPRPKLSPDAAAVQALEKAGADRQRADDLLREAVYAAKDAGGSVREIARIGQLAPSTVQEWLKRR